MNIYDLEITAVVNYFRGAAQGSEAQVTQCPIPAATRNKQLAKTTGTEEMYGDISCFGNCNTQRWDMK